MAENKHIYLLYVQNIACLRFTELLAVSPEASSAASRPACSKGKLLSRADQRKKVWQRKERPLLLQDLLRGFENLSSLDKIFYSTLYRNEVKQFTVC